MNIFLAKNSDTEEFFAYSYGPGNALLPNDSKNILHAKMCATFDEIINAIPVGYVDRYDIQRWTFKCKEKY